LSCIQPSSQRRDRSANLASASMWVVAAAGEAVAEETEADVVWHPETVAASSATASRQGRMAIPVWWKSQAYGSD